jgi:Chitobiase/beta-hexosaminidase C-terminal domain
VQPIPRRWRAAFATAVIGSAAAPPVPAAQAEVISVDANRNVGIFHNIDFVAGFGWQVGQPMTVEVFRNDQRIGSATGPTIAVDEGLPLQGALEVNHGPEGAPQPGDCWTNFTPDIQPGDRVEVTQGLETDSVVIDPITVDRGPFVNSDGHVQVEGRAARPDGTPIPIAFLDSHGVLNTSKFRGGPNRLFRTPGTTDGYTMTFDPASPMSAAGRDGREPDGLDVESRLGLLMSGEYGAGYGHVAPLPRETQLFEGNEDAPGPALGCEASRSESNGVTGADGSAVNITSADLVVNGTVMAGTFDNDITEVVAKVSDGTRTVSSAPIDVSGAVRTWTATFRRADLAALADGDLTLSADYITSEGPIGGHTMVLPKDTVAPVVSASQAPGEYTGPLSVALGAGPGETIRYRTDGLPHGDNDRVYEGPIALPVGTTTIDVRVTDAAGNTSDQLLTYTVNEAAAPAPPAVAAPAPFVAPPVVVAPQPARSLSARTLRARKRIKVRTARRSGMRVSFLAPRGAKVAQVRLYRKSGSRKILVESRSMRVSSNKRFAVRFRKVRKAALYVTEIRVGASRRTLGAPSIFRTRVIR